MKRTLTILMWLWTVAYAFALAIFLIGLFGLFGQERSPLSAVYLMPLGLPWNLWLDFLAEALRPWAAILAPLVNIALLWLARRAVN